MQTAASTDSTKPEAYCALAELYLSADINLFGAAFQECVSRNADQSILVLLLLKLHESVTNQQATEAAFRDAVLMCPVTVFRDVALSIYKQLPDFALELVEKTVELTGAQDRRAVLDAAIFHVR